MSGVFLSFDAVCMGSPVTIMLNKQVSRHTVVCRVAQDAGAPHREYINRKKENNSLSN